jgi:hypothetical protein
MVVLDPDFVEPGDDDDPVYHRITCQGPPVCDYSALSGAAKNRAMDVCYWCRHTFIDPETGASYTTSPGHA